MDIILSLIFLVAFSFFLGFLVGVLNNKSDNPNDEVTQDTKLEVFLDEVKRQAVTGKGGPLVYTDPEKGIILEASKIVTYKPPEKCCATCRSFALEKSADEPFKPFCMDLLVETSSMSYCNLWQPIKKEKSNG